MLSRYQKMVAGVEAVQLERDGFQIYLKGETDQNEGQN